MLQMTMTMLPKGCEAAADFSANQKCGLKAFSLPHRLGELEKKLRNH